MMMTVERWALVRPYLSVDIIWSVSHFSYDCYSKVGFVSRYFVCAKCCAGRKFVVGRSVVLSSSAVSPYVFANCCSVGGSVIPSAFRVPPVLSYVLERCAVVRRCVFATSHLLLHSEVTRSSGHYIRSLRLHIHVMLHSILVLFGN